MAAIDHADGELDISHDLMWLVDFVTSLLCDYMTV